ncbi:MAG: HAMP domain-containing sensor histidine kinase [Lachnospiraceae bacterium]|nr:HAMP domain-containing sensor histidine kinase [Lachnospiraceae bacterium]
MKKKLKPKFILGFLAFGLTGFLLISTLASDAVLNVLIRIRAESLYENAENIVSDCISSYDGNMVPLTSKKNEYNGLAKGIESFIWIADSEGTIIYDSEGTFTGRTIPSFDPASFAQGKNRISGYAETGFFYNMFSEKQLSVMSSIHVSYQTRGYVMIHIPISLIEQHQYEILNLMYLTGLVLFALSFLILLIFQLCVYRPLGEIIHAADEYAGGNLKYRCPVTSNDELGYLSATLNYMASELNNTEEYQRKFISNVSHDFRSPLTSIRGYLVAILDGTIPPELYEKYLNIVIRETERLNKLTEGLLTLNQLGSGSSSGLNLSSFDINQTIKDTCATFEGGCRSKNLTFNLTFSDKTMMVRADFGKIQQVIYNLVDNAIKFSKTDSTIDIETYDRNGKVFVSIKDHGCGIAKENQKKIFERFYKADNSRGKDKQGTGLGLSITKEIINAHQQNIDVVSTEGVGTEFIFTLMKI